jgi:putative transposase
MEEDNIIALAGREETFDPLTDLLQTGARQLICQAVEAEFSAFLKHYDGQKTPDGHAVVVRNGHHPERDIQTGIGPVTVKVPKVRGKMGKAVTFHSALVPPYVRKSQSIEAALPWLYLKGISSGEMDSALKV